MRIRRKLELAGPRLSPAASARVAVARVAVARLFAGLVLPLMAFGGEGWLLMRAARPVAASETATVPQPPAMGQSNPDVICASCHKEIYDKYEATPMAQGSGLAVDGLLQGGFLHQPSGIDYRVFLRDGQVWMSYDRVGGAGGVDALHGERQLMYYIGSGHRGRTYLYEQADGRAGEGGALWFEAPINYYTRKALWDMAPNYGGVGRMPDALPVDSNCLHCHATEVRTALPQARNSYAGAPFLQGGVGCSACHGDGAEHVARKGRGAIVNPGKLDAARRDSTCLQCHLEGDAAIYRAGTSLAKFRAGDDLDDYVVYFVKANSQTGGGRASSQYEALLRSACKAGSGDKLTCATCHDPHSRPAAAERVAYFRSRCLSCHTGVKMATQHHPDQQDCSVCHMPTRDTTDISHEQLTDHNIQARPVAGEGPRRLKSLGQTGGATAIELAPVGKASVGDRELGLAYALMAAHGDQATGRKALALLLKAEAAGDNDEQVHVQVGFLEQMAGDGAAAMREYAAALRQNPFEASALGNLAVLDAGTGKANEAVGLLRRVVDADPSQTAAGLNLAFIECELGEKQKAAALLGVLAKYNPDDAALRRFEETGVYAGQRCALR